MKIMSQSNFKFECQRCRRKQIISDFNLGEVFCGFCGFVINTKLENLGYDSCDIENQKDVRRTGASRTLSRHDFGLSTIISSENKDSKGNSIPSALTSTIKRIRIQDSRSQLGKYCDINFKVAFDYLERIQDKLGVSDNVKETAAYIYRKAVEQKITTGRQINSVVAASMYIACRNTQTLRNLKDISDVTNIKKRRLSQSYRAIVKQLDLKIPVVNQTDYIMKISNILKISRKTQNLALQILQKVDELDMLAGRDPVGIAAASIYYSNLIINEGFSQIQIATAAGVTAVTIRNRFHEIKKNIQIKNGKNPIIIINSNNKSNTSLEGKLHGKI